MKLGILTWWFGANYGAKLHSYALQKTIQKFGYECEFINYYPFRLRYWHFRGEISLRHPLTIPRTFFRHWLIQKFTRMFNVGKKVYKASKIDTLGYDLISIGSDELLKLDHAMHDSIYYGVGINSPKMIFSASAGQTDSDRVLREDYIESLKQMVGINVRGTSTQRLLRNNGIPNVGVVLDPTLLYDFSEFQDKFEYENYIIVYAFYSIEDIKEELLAYAKKNDLKIISTLKKYNWVDETIVPTVEQWIESFKRAKLVVTDSFHATCFSIKNHLEFIPVGSKSKINKIGDLLKLVGIDRPFYEGEEIDEYCETHPIDYTRVDKNLMEYRDLSIKVLNQCIMESIRH